MRDEDFKLAKVKIFLTSDAKEAQAAYEDLQKTGASRETVLAKMSYLKKEGDHLSAIQTIPYNLGQLLKKISPGQALEPIVVREGILVTYLEEMRQTTKPTLEKTTEEIKGLLVGEKLDAEVKALRKAASIELKY